MRVARPDGEIVALWRFWLFAHDTRNPTMAGAAAFAIKGWGARHA